MKREWLTILFVGFFTVSYAQQTEKTLDDIQVYPNATSDILFLRNGELAETYRIIDMNGKVAQQGYCNSQIITILDLESGFYLLELKTGGKIRSVKIQKR